MTRRRTRRVARLGTEVAVAVLALTLSACGGPTKQEYAGRLDRLCAQERHRAAQLPRIAEERHLDAEQVQRLARRDFHRADRRFDQIEVPEDLRPEAARLRALTHAKPPATRQSAIRWYRDLEAAYQHVGATGCARGMRQGIERLRTDAAGH